MSQVVHNAQHEFWSPPTVQEPVAAPAMVEVCAGCGAEFMVGARFCHRCGATRHLKANASSEQSWTRHLEFLRALEFQNIQQWLNLPTASLVAFLAGVGCLLTALMVGLVYSAQTFQDFEAIQFWRVQWLLSALVAFVAGILLKQPRASEKSEK
jgi:ribosomal protein L40E